MERRSISRDNTDRQRTRYKSKLPQLQKVPVRLELLNKLKEHDKLLENYVEEYVCCAQLLNVCKEIREIIALGTTDPTNLETSFYWNSIRKEVDRLSLDLGSVPLHDSDFGTAVQALKKPLQGAIDAVDGVIRASSDDPKIVVATTVSRSIDQIWGIIITFMGKTQTLTKSQLQEIGKIIERIDELIKVEETAAKELTKPAPSPMPDYAAKRKLDESGKVAVSYAVKEGSTPGNTF
jgi:rRNA-processing protein FCF1